MADRPVPEYTDLASVYGGLPGIPERYERIKTAFELAFDGNQPELYARAPGRVNLIGEHIDYEGYGVLPMAIRQDTIIAIRKGGTKLVVGNVDTEKYPTMEFDTDPKQEVDTHNHTWANYFLSAYKGVYDYLGSRGRALPEPCGLQVVVHGEVPTGSGLSSSAAFVCSASLAVLGAHGIALSKGEVAEFACLAERYVGVTSGGMDQAISMMGMAGLAMNVEFNPVRAHDVELPPGAVFVIANSLTVSNKAETAPKRYNLRVVECRLAAGALAIALGASAADARGIKTLREVEPLIEAKYGSADKAAAAVEELPKESYTQQELEDLLGVPLLDLFEGVPGSIRALQVASSEGYHYPLRARAVHVYSEAARVTEFTRTCEHTDTPAPERLAALGGLMDASHASCDQLYACSCPELNSLVAAAKKAGALGARLTGAGWGGCAVFLVGEGNEEEFMAHIKQEYYAPLIERGVVAEADLPDCLFATKPSNGAAIIRLNKAQ